MARRSETAANAAFRWNGRCSAGRATIRGGSPSLTSSVRRQISSPRRLVLGNVLISLGTLVLSGSGSLAGRFGKDQAFAVTLLSGVTVLFVGFLVASNSLARTRRMTALALIGD